MYIKESIKLISPIITEIPYYLSKNDCIVNKNEHSCLSRSLNAEFTPENPMGLTVFEIIDLEDLDETELIIDTLYQLENGGCNESKLVVAWLIIYNEFYPEAKLSPHVILLVKSLAKDLNVSNTLVNTLRNTINRKIDLL